VRSRPIPEVRFYEAEIAHARAARSTAGRQSNPELSLDIGRKRVSSSDARSNGLAFSAELAQPLEWPGRLGLRKAIANRDITLAELGLERFRFHLASRVRVLATTLAAQQDISAAAEEVATRHSALRDVLVQREPAGIAPQLEVVTVEAAALVAESRAATAAVAVQTALLELNQLMGRRPDTPIAVERSSFSLKPVPSLNQLLSAAMENHYDLRILHAELQQQGFKVELAKNERYPAIVVGPFIEREEGLEDETTGGIGISLPLPFWKSGKAEVTAAEARQTQAQASLGAAQREVERQVTESMLMFKTQQSRVSLWKGDAVAKFGEAAASGRSTLPSWRGSHGHLRGASGQVPRSGRGRQRSPRPDPRGGTQARRTHRSPRESLHSQFIETLTTTLSPMKHVLLILLIPIAAALNSCSDSAASPTPETESAPENGAQYQRG
jgi:cobalt-zinc-cadmium efflux system outer membrane protein